MNDNEVRSTGADDDAPAARQARKGRTPTDERRGIQSVEVGGQLLRALAEHGRPMALKELAQEAHMAAAKAHPYLVSYGRMGLVEQEAVSGRYRLGPLALQMGLISLQQASPVHVATPALAPLALRLGQTTALSVWSGRGPTIVRVEESPAVLFASMRHGTVFSLTATATGRLFAAYLERKRVKELFEEERAAERGRAASKEPGAPVRARAPSWAGFERQLDEVCTQGISRSAEGLVSGINAMAVPVFDATGAIVLGITAVGPIGTFDAGWDGDIARELKRQAAELSRKLGAA